MVIRGVYEVLRAKFGVFGKQAIIIVNSQTKRIN